MPELNVAVAGLGRMGVIHALHVHELEKESKKCRLAALVDIQPDRARSFAASLGLKDVPVFASIEEMIRAKVCDATVVVTPTDNHRATAESLVGAGHRVLLEKPLTGSLEGDESFSRVLDREHPNAIMLAFQRRFDEPLRFAKQLLNDGAIGRVFKIYSALEDSNPAPDGYRSGGILPDMSVHNVDEILWLTGRMPRAALAVGSRIYSHRLTTCEEDFDDATLLLWFEGELTAQVQVGRNHVSGYRVETVIYGEEGQIHVGRFDQKPRDITAEAYGRRGRTDPIAYRTFSMRDYAKPLPEFMDRFGPAYKSEVETFIDCCRAGDPFPTTHRDGLQAQLVISAGMRGVLTEEQATPVEAVSASTRT